MKNNLYRKGFIVPVLLSIIALLIIGGGVYIYKNKKVEAPVVVNESEEVGLDNQQEVAPIGTTIKNTNIKTFKLGNLEFSYPDILTLKEDGNKISLSHSINQKHQNRCDFVGDKPTLDKINDLGISFEVINKDTYNSIKSFFPAGDDIAATLLKNNTITLDPGFIDKYKIGSLDGYKITRGFEGCGGYYYFFPISSSQTLSVYRIWSSQTVGQTTDAYMLKLPGIISTAQEEQIFKDILSSTSGLGQKETMSVKVYFGDTIDAQSCHTPSYVERIIPKTTAVARASIEELLKGPTEAEKLKDFWTSLRSGVSINSISINNGVASLDLSTSQASSLNDPNKGACGASIVIKQIENTLKQFSTIKSVVITVNGKPAENSIDP